MCLPKQPKTNVVVDYLCDGDGKENGAKSISCLQKGGVTLEWGKLERGYNYKIYCNIQNRKHCM